MQTHPFGEPFGPALVEKKRVVCRRPNFADDIPRDVAKKCDFFDGEHMAQVVLGDLVKLLLIMLHKESLLPRVVAGTTDQDQPTRRRANDWNGSPVRRVTA